MVDLVGDSAPGKQVHLDVVLLIVVRVGYGGVGDVALIATLDSGPDGVFLDVEDSVDTGDILPGGIGAELYLARGEGH